MQKKSNISPKKKKKKASQKDRETTKFIEL